MMKENIGTIIFLKKRQVRPFFVLVAIILTFSSCFESWFQPHSRLPYATDSLRRSDSTTLNFMLLSDWGFNGAHGQKDVAAQMAVVARASAVRFILTCGDNFQYTGVDSVTDKLWDLNYEQIYTDSSLFVPWYPALGNHDYLGSPDSEIAYTSHSTRWKMPSRYYTFVGKINQQDSVRFIVMDTQGLINDYRSLQDTNQIDSIAQYRWLKNLLSTNKAKWTFVTGHHPVYSAAPFHGDTYEMNKLIKPLFNEYKVDFYICGHDHHFEHAKAAGDYTNFFVTGTGGYNRPDGKNERTIFSMSSLGFTFVSLKYDKAKIYFITADGRIGYQFLKTK